MLGESVYDMDIRVSSQLESIKKTILNNIEAEAIYLFGSYAYGTQKDDSDFDLYVIIPDHGMRPVEAARIINNSLYKEHRIPVDILVGKASDFRRRSRLPTIERMIARDGIRLHG